MPDNVVLFLSKVRELVRTRKRRFVARTYQGRSYKEVLVEDFGIDINKAWEVISSLKVHDYVVNTKPNYLDDSDAYIFKRLVNGEIAYIKIVIECLEEEIVVCISFRLGV